MTASERSLTRRLQEDRERLIDALERLIEAIERETSPPYPSLPLKTWEDARAVLASVKEGK